MITIIQYDPKDCPHEHLKPLDRDVHKCLQCDSVFVATHKCYFINGKCDFCGEPEK